MNWLQLHWAPGVCVHSIAVLGAFGFGCAPFPTQDISWRIAMTTAERRAKLVEFTWRPWQLGPTIHQAELQTRNDVEATWASRDGAFYVTRELEHGDLGRWGHARIRVYLRDGTVIGEYKNAADDDEISVPTLVNFDKSVVFISKNGEVVRGNVDVVHKKCDFQALAIRGLPRKRVMDFELLLPLSENTIACYSRFGDLVVYVVDLIQGTTTEIKEARLYGVVDSELVINRGDHLLIHAGGREQRMPARITYTGWKSPNSVNRLAPRGRYLFFDSGGILGFRLRLAELSSGRNRLISKLGQVSHIGSWHELQGG